MSDPIRHPTDAERSRRPDRRERPSLEVTQARPQDAAALAEFTVMAGEGMPLVLWAAMAEPGETAIEVGRRRAARGDGDFSWRNAELARDEGQVIAAILSYPLAEPTPEAQIALAPPLVRPLIELENLVPGSWYVNVLATVPEWRGHGIGARLLAHVEGRARARGFDRMSIITGDGNPAGRLYERSGFVEVARRPKTNPDGRHDWQDWVLSVKPLG